MKKILVLFFTFLTATAFAQKNPTEEAAPIVAEGKLLYKSEMASWYGTDLFLEKYKDRKNLGGYFSYSHKNVTKCIFFSKGDDPKVIGTISFKGDFDTEKAKTDLSERDFTDYENALYLIRRIALAEIEADTFFKTYKNTNFNLVPLIQGNEKKVYVLTGPQQNGVIIFGNDYLLTFDENNTLILKKQLHRNIIPMYYEGEEADGKQAESAIHTHSPETGDFITATDICTLMLYAKFAKWKSYHVISQKYLNIWNCETETLTVIAKPFFNKMNKTPEKQE